ncbi:hypothetical protein BDY19DRAFT_502309 [Irpex rosettiformis]|uniref:Uncharacterized protein n=1 Tax=Irpex rosettiformis TaxID=378272 RepID=A0ACB8UEI0_9APHY|nr:hypothetical protein BDY19DRAFT_502309 [Irpex rosettiformis]
MKFATRNLYYLRLSAGAVIPLYIYLDEQHVSWMSERVLQHVLADLRPLIATKLLMEENANTSANAKKGTVDVHRGDTYQFGYFLRNTDPHAVLVKTRRFTAAQKVVKPTYIPPPQNDSDNVGKKAGRKRGRKVAAESKAKKSSKGKGKARQVQSDTEEEAEFSGNASEGGTGDRQNITKGMAVRRSARRRRMPSGSYVENDEGGDLEDADLPSDDDALANSRNGEGPNDRGDIDIELRDVEDVAMTDNETPRPPPEEDTLMVEEEEEKPKPVLQLRYQSFSIHGRCLCVIVEPYPPIRQQRQMSLAPTGISAPRAPSIAPSDFVPSGAARRSKTPLFLPDDDEDFYGRRSVTPAPIQQRSLPPVPLFHETPDEAEENADEEDGGMLAFSQVLHTMGDHYTGAVDDDDEMEGMVLFGDADEIRGL